MQLSCIHTHTKFCDGHDDVETYCRVALEKGLVSLGFSAHAPVAAKTGIKSSWNLPDKRLDEYLDAVRAAQKRWEGKLPVYLGLEVDFIPGLIGPADRDFREMGIDFIIGSVHYLVPPHGMIFTVDDKAANVDLGIKEGFGGDPLGMVEAYYNSLEAMILAGGFDLLGHPDLVKNNNLNQDGSGCRLFSEDTDFYQKKISSVAALLSRTGIPAEVNTGGMNRGKINDCYPSPGFLRLLREQGVSMAINADAHRAEHLDGHYTEARKAMLNAGYSETVLFNGKKNGQAVWYNAKL